MKRQKSQTNSITIYIVLNYKDYKGHRSNWALLRKADAELWNEEGDGSGVVEVQSEELGWMKEAADAACHFDEDAAFGSLEIGTLSDRIKNYQREIFER